MTLILKYSDRPKISFYTKIYNMTTHGSFCQPDFNLPPNKEREIVPLKFAIHYGEIQDGGLNGRSVRSIEILIEIWLKLQLVIEKYLDN